MSIEQSREEGKVQAGGENICLGLHAKLFWLFIYCAKPRPNPGSQSGSGFPVPQKTGETSSTDHAGVQTFDRNCGPAVNPETYVTGGVHKGNTQLILVELWTTLMCVVSY